MKKTPIAVLISGRGSNLEALIKACSHDDFPAKIVLVLSNNKEAKGLEMAHLANIPTEVLSHKEFATRNEFDLAMDQTIRHYQAQVICLAGFMRLLTKEFVTSWSNQILNIHPSLLPAFKGVNAPKQAIEAGVKYAGCTVHIVTEDMDSGPIIAQKCVEVRKADTEETLAQRILKEEHQCYPRALKDFLLGTY